MAPEAFDGKRNEQTDIWSVGVIFYQLLAGYLPFQEQDITSLVGAILMRNPEPLPPEVPKPLQNVIARALAKDINIRYTSAAEMRKALRNPHETDPNYRVDKSILTEVSPSINNSPTQSFHQPTNVKSNSPHLIYAIAGLLAIVFVVGLIGIYYLPIAPKSNVEDMTTKANTVKGVTPITTIPAARNNVGEEKQPRQFTSQTFQIPEECLRVDLQEGPNFYPKGGGIKIITPSGKSFVDLPGVERNQSYEKPGTWTFCPEPKKSVRAIEIYNWW